MAVRAVAFDIGGVLERVAPQEDWLRPWQQRLGLAEPEFAAAIARVDPDRGIGTGRLPEAAYRRRFAHELGLSSAQAAEFIADMWRWYCGELRVSPDEVVFLDDVSQNVEAACQFGLHGLLHQSTPESIAAINSLIAA